jgi:hypothetical protein
VSDAGRELDLAAALGAEREPSTQILSVYIPNKDRHGRAIRTARWLREAQKVLTKIGEGYTTPPPHDGGWETTDGTLRREKTVIVYTSSSQSGYSLNSERCVSVSTVSVVKRIKRSLSPS